MKYTYFIFLLVALSFGQNVNSQTTISKTLYFNVDDHSLSSASQGILESLITELSRSNESSLQIIGHTDQDGSLEYNMLLSENRANAVKQFIVSLGYAANDIELNFLGESDLLTDAKDHNSKQQNRRVTVIANQYNYSSVRDFISLLETNNADQSIIDNSKAEEIMLAKGTNVKVPSNAFCHMDGSPLSDHKIEMTFKEAFDYTQMVDQRLSTVTAGDLLETGGMIYIEASQNGRQLKLKDGKKIELLFPQQKRKDDMELFTGVNTEDGVIWEETGEPISVEKEEPFIQVDISPIKDYVFDFIDTIQIPYENMAPYPRAQRKPYPPARSNYTDEKYAEVYRKYEEVLAIYNADKVEVPKEVEIWISELLRRKDLLIQHKKEYAKARVQKLLQFNVEKITSNSATDSHIEIVNRLNTFLDRSIGDIGYNDSYYRDKMFKGVSRDIINAFDVYQPYLAKESIREFCKKFILAINSVNRDIQDRKVELGYADQDLTSRYIVRTSNVGWINCDRFIKLQEDERMELNFAVESLSKDYYLFFKDMKSLIRPQKMNGQVSFKGVPVGEDVRVVSLEVKDGACYLAYQDLILGSSEEVDLRYSKAKLSDVRNTLETI